MTFFAVTILAIVTLLILAALVSTLLDDRDSARLAAKRKRQRQIRAFEREDYRERHNSATHPNWRRKV